jgi:CSLREA domain-containing protein
MNRKTFKFASRGAAAVLLFLASVSVFAVVLVRSSANSEQITANAAKSRPAIITATRNSTVAAEKQTPEAVTLKAEKRGFPLMNLRDSKRLDTEFVGASPADSLVTSSAKPRTLANTDINADGALDLIVGYASGDGSSGHLAVYQGSKDTLSATSPEVFKGFQRGEFPAPFLSEARLIKLPVAPDFVGTGDFNRDGSKDIIAAGRNDAKAFLLLGNGEGAFKTTFVELPGQVTAMLADNIDPLDNVADIAFAVNTENGASLLIYKGASNVFSDAPLAYRLPAQSASLAIGQLDNQDPMDIIAAVGGRVAIIHGSYPDENQSARASQVEILDQVFDAAAVRVGNFVWDRENRPEIAVLGADGSVRILERGGTDRRMLTKAEFKARALSHRELMKQEEASRNLNYKPQRANKAFKKWAETDRIQVSSSLNLASGASTAFFTSARMTPLGVEDLLVVDAASRKVNVLVSNNDELKKSGESFALSGSGERAVVSLDIEAGTPVAALPMRLSVMNRPGIVLLNEESNEISYALSAPAATFNVTKTADTYDGACNADCSFREALEAANATAALDMIVVPAGTYTIDPALGSPDDEVNVGPDIQESGDWDVFKDTTITGAGQATTILQGAAAQPGHDRVLDAVQNAVGTPDLTISGVTIRNGRCRADIACVDGGGLRFAVDAQAVLTISDSTFDNNRTEVSSANPSNNGGAIFGSQADYNFTNLTLTNNIAGVATGLCKKCGGEGGGMIIIGTSSANPTSLTMTNNAISGNQARTGRLLGGRGGALASSPNSVSITGGTFNNNSADLDGGAFRLFTATTISNATISNNSAKQNAGGIWSDPLDNANNPLTNTFTNLTMKGNVADSNNAQVEDDGEMARGDGGAIYHNRGILNLNNSTIGGTVAGDANKAFNGGGISNNAGTVNIPTPAGANITGNTATSTGGGIFNSSGTLSITGGSISGNTADTGKGGGVEHSGSSVSHITGVTINGNTGSGILITGAGSLDAANNTITNNTGDGITKTGTGTSSHFDGNTIHSNGDLGIDLGVNGVTQNDTNDTDTGANNLQNFPVINSVTAGANNTGTASVTLNAADGNYRIQYFANANCDSSGYGEGEVFLTSQTVTVSGNTTTFNSPALNYGAKKRITATATDDNGNSSEFSACRVANASPTIASTANVSRQQGSAGSNSQIASVADSDQTANTLTVTVNGGSSATVNGVTVSGVAVDATGNVTANVVASCSASSNANFTLRATDAEGAFNETTLNVTVNPNTAPTVGDYPSTNVSTGGNTTVTPGAAPGDNGSVASATATASGFTGTLSVDSTTGAVTVGNANPPGAYTVSVAFTDNCGLTTTKQFTLRVNAPPTANPDSYSTNEDTPLSIAAPGVLQNDTDPDAGDTLTAVLVSGPANAQSFALNSNGSFSYTPGTNFNGSDSFSYKARDNNNADSASVTVTITVNPVNDAPSFASGGDVTVAEDSGAYNATWATAISKGAANENGQTVGFIIANNSNPALFSSSPAIAPNGTLSFTPAMNASGNATITVVLKDDGGTQNGGVDTSAPVSFTIIVTPVNDPPTIEVVAGGSCSNGGSIGTINLVVNDVDNHPSVVAVSGSSSETTVVPNSNIVFGGTGTNRTMTITPLPENHLLPNSIITITANDGFAGTSTITVNVIVGANGTQTITGTSGADMIFGFNGGDTINAGAGRDLVCGGNGNDTMNGGGDDDTLVGDHGNDTLRGEDGNDFLTGGSGADSFSGGSGTDAFVDFNPAEGDTSDNTLALLTRALDGSIYWAEE